MEHKKSTVILSKLRWTYGGELGIRTLGTLRTQHFECCTFDHSDNSPYSILHFLLARIILSNILCFVNKNLRQTEKTVCRRVLIKKAFYKLRYCVYRYFIAQRVAVFFAQDFECSVIVAVAQKLRKFFV